MAGAPRYGVHLAAMSLVILVLALANNDRWAALAGALGLVAGVRFAVRPPRAGRPWRPPMVGGQSSTTIAVWAGVVGIAVYASASVTGDTTASAVTFGATAALAVAAMVWAALRT